MVSAKYKMYTEGSVIYIICKSCSILSAIMCNHVLFGNIGQCPLWFLPWFIMAHASVVSLLLY